MEAVDDEAYTPYAFNRAMRRDVRTCLTSIIIKLLFEHNPEGLVTTSHAYSSFKATIDHVFPTVGEMNPAKFGGKLKFCFPDVRRCRRTSQNVWHYINVSMKPKDVLMEDSIPTLGKIQQLFADCNCNGSLFIVKHVVFLRDLLCRMRDSNTTDKESAEETKLRRVIDGQRDYQEAFSFPFSGSSSRAADVIEISDSETDSQDEVDVESAATTWCVEDGVLMQKIAKDASGGANDSPRRNWNQVSGKEAGGSPTDGQRNEVAGEQWNALPSQQWNPIPGGEVGPAPGKNGHSRLSTVVDNVISQRLNRLPSGVVPTALSAGKFNGPSATQAASAPPPQGSARPQTLIWNRIPETGYVPGSAPVTSQFGRGAPTIGDLVLPMPPPFPRPEQPGVVLGTGGNHPRQNWPSNMSAPAASSGQSAAGTQSFLLSISPDQRKVSMVRLDQALGRDGNSQLGTVNRSGFHNSSGRDSGVGTDSAYSTPEPKRKTETKSEWKEKKAKKHKGKHQSKKDKKQRKSQKKKRMEEQQNDNEHIPESVICLNKAKFKQTKCKHCFAKFPSKMTLQMHMQVVHPKHILKQSRPFPGSRKLFVPRIAENAPVYECAVCQRSFGGSSGYRSHMRISHAKCHQYVCQQCNRLAFVRKYDFLVHRKRVHARRPIRKAKEGTRADDGSGNSTSDGVLCSDGGTTSSGEDFDGDHSGRRPCVKRAKVVHRKRKISHGSETTTDTSDEESSRDSLWSKETYADGLVKPFSLPESCLNLSIDQLYPAVSLTKMPLMAKKVVRAQDGGNTRQGVGSCQAAPVSSNTPAVPAGDHQEEDTGSCTSDDDEAPCSFQPRIKRESGVDAYQGLYQCPYCDIIFPDTTMYLTHRNFHSYDNPFKCRICQVMCADRYSFQKHRCEIPDYNV